MKRITRFLTVFFVMFLLASCGAPQPSTSINVTLTDFEFSPNVFTVPAGQQITINISNNGGTNHSFAIMKLGQNVTAHFTDADKQNVYWGKFEIASGDSVSDTFTAPSDPGEYQIVCAQPGHFEAGMVAKLIVVKP